ncbi:MAG: hypothetical protein QOK43_3163 [Acidimicrobiaceae bacterium]|nr:hypothetical protein [Acidimicrobiaceae bacterium]
MAARVWRRRLAPRWSGPLAVLADAIGALSGLVVISELLGSVGLFRTWALMAAVVAAGAGSAFLLEGRGQDRSGPDEGEASVESTESGPTRHRSVADVVIVAASSALVLGQWATWVGRGVETGIGRGGGPGNGDSLWYHMPFAANFVQSGWTSRLQFLNGEALVTYYPANTSLLHAIAYLAMGNDMLSILLNIAMVPLALLAGWCIGEDAGVAPASLAGVAVALTIPVVVVSEASTAKDDVLGLVGLLAAIAFVVHERAVSTKDGRRAGAIFSGLGAGLALGAKLTLVAPIAALAVSLAVLTPKGLRLGTIVRWSVATVATGSYWYLRNLFAIGNPIPGLRIGAGPIELARPPTPSMDVYGHNLLRHVTDWHLWRVALLPGLRTGMGSAWFVIIGIMAVAMGVGIITLRRHRLVPAVVAVFAFAVFFVTPGTVWAPQLIATPGVHFVTANLFGFNLRYMLPAVAIALVIVPLVMARWTRARLLVTAVLGVVLAATQLGRGGADSWPKGFAPVAILTAAVAFALVAAWPWLVQRRRAALAVGLAAVVVLGWPMQVRYRSRRFVNLDVARWAERRHGARIGYSGFVFSYPLYGRTLDNHVEMLGQRGPQGAWQPVETCEAWRAMVRSHRIEYVVVPVGGPQPELGIDLARWRIGLPGGQPPDEPPESRWTRNDPGAHVVFVGDGLAAYAITGPPSTYRCS